MRRKKVSTQSYADIFWAFLRDNPELARTIAFELGSLAGTAVGKATSNTKYLKGRVKKMPQAIADAMPPSLSNALKFLPAPKLQPHKKPHAKRSSQRKAKHAV